MVISVKSSLLIDIFELNQTTQIVITTSDKSGKQYIATQQVYTTEDVDGDVCASCDLESRNHRIFLFFMTRTLWLWCWLRLCFCDSRGHILLSTSEVSCLSLSDVLLYARTPSVLEWPVLVIISCSSTSASNSRVAEVTRSE